MEGLGTAILIVAVGGILLFAVLAIEVVVLIRRLRQPDLRPDRRGWLLLGGSLLVATAIGAGAYVGLTGGVAFIGLAVVVWLATVLLLVGVVDRPNNRRLLVLYAVGVVFQLGLCLGFYVLPRTPLIGDAIGQVACDADPACDSAAAVVRADAQVTLHLAGDEGWLLDAAGQMDCQLDPRPESAHRLLISGAISATDGGAVRFDLIVGFLDAMGGNNEVSFEMDRVAPDTGIYPRLTLVVLGDGPLALGHGELRMDGVRLAQRQQPMLDRPDIKGTLQWSCDALELIALPYTVIAAT